MARDGKKRIASLDLLRLIAALAVVAFHYFFAGPASPGYLAVAYPEAAPFAIYGYLGVNLFFLISGYVIAWSADGRDALDFAAARFIRLYPGHFAAMSVTFMVMGIAGLSAFPVGASQYLANLTMLAPAFGHSFMDGAYWSIVLELVFYFWVAAALVFGLFERRRLDLAASWLLLSVANEFLFDSEPLRLLFITEYAGFFAGGIVAYEAGKNGWRAEAIVLGAAAFLFATASLFSGRDWMLDHYGVALSPGAVVAASAAVHVLFFGALALRLPESGGIAFAGALTYPLYLLHQHIGYALIGAIAPWTGRWAAAAVAMLFVALLAGAIVILVERPAQTWLKPRLKRLADRLSSHVSRFRSLTARS